MVRKQQDPEERLLKLAIYKTATIPVLDTEFMLSLSESEARYVMEGDKTSSLLQEIDNVYICSRAMADEIKSGYLTIAEQCSPDAQIFTETGQGLYFDGGTYEKIAEQLFEDPVGTLLTVQQYEMIEGNGTMSLCIDGLEHPVSVLELKFPSYY